MPTYTKTTWVNDQAPAINDTNLNNIESGLENLYNEYDANTILKADSDNTPIKLAVAASRILGRKSTGGVAALTVTEIEAMLTGLVPKTLYDAYSILYADTDNTPAALTVAASRFVGRKAAGGIAAMTVAEAKTLLAIVKADISDFSHSHEQHTNRTRKLFIGAGAGHGTGALALLSGWTAANLDAAADESWYFVFRVPINYASGGTVKFLYMEDMGNTGDVIWDANLRHNDLSADNYLANLSSDAANTVTMTTDGKIKEVTTSLSFSSLAIGELVSVEIKRDADNGSDDFGADWRLLGIVFEYTADE